MAYQAEPSCNLHNCVGPRTPTRQPAGTAHCSSARMGAEYLKHNSHAYVSRRKWDHKRGTAIRDTGLIPKQRGNPAIRRYAGAERKQTARINRDNVDVNARWVSLRGHRAHQRSNPPMQHNLLTAQLRRIPAIGRQITASLPRPHARFACRSYNHIPLHLRQRARRFTNGSSAPRARHLLTLQPR